MSYLSRLAGRTDDEVAPGWIQALAGAVIVSIGSLPLWWLPSRTMAPWFLVIPALMIAWSPISFLLDRRRARLIATFGYSRTPRSTDDQRLKAIEFAPALNGWPDRFSNLPLEDALAMLDVARSYGSSQLWMVNRRAFNVFFPDARASRLAEAHRFLDALILDLSKSHLGDGKQWLRDAAVRYPGLRPETYQALLSREYYYRR